MGLGVAGAYSNTLRCRKTGGTAAAEGALTEAQVVAAAAASLVSQQEAAADSSKGTGLEACPEASSSAGVKMAALALRLGAGVSWAIGGTEAGSHGCGGTNGVASARSVLVEMGWRRAPHMVQ